MPSDTLAEVQRSPTGKFSPSAYHTESQACLLNSFVNQHLFPSVICPYVTKQTPVESLLGDQRMATAGAAKRQTTFSQSSFSVK